MDPIESITVEKDTTLAMMLAAQARGWKLKYFQRTDLSMRDGSATATMRDISVQDNPQHWFDLGAAEELRLAECDCILMRLDPPFNMDYVFTTYFLQRASDDGVLAVSYTHLTLPTIYSV